MTYAEILELAGKQFAAPIFAAPIGLIEGNYASHLNERTYGEAVVCGAQQGSSTRAQAAAFLVRFCEM